jgi:hypothetical protein
VPDGRAASDHVPQQSLRHGQAGYASSAVDLHVTQLVDYAGIAMIPKECFFGKQYADRNGLLIPKQA